VKTIRIFVSSPSDVAEERSIAARVIQRLQERYEDVTNLNAIFWEHEPLLATQSFQDQIPRPSQADIVVCTLWSRLGTRLPEHYKRADGTPYASGTEFEFDDAATTFRQSGRPDLLVYRKTADAMVSLLDEEGLLERLQQRRALDDFIQRWFYSTDRTFAAAYHAFKTADEYEALLDRHLSKLILKHLPEEDRNIQFVTKRWAEGSPFRGLEVFEYQHAPVFYGRSRAVGALLQRLRSRAQAGRPFVLVVGMSGGGKSSLVRAGLLPQLTSPGVMEGIGTWRWCLVRPSDRNPTLIDALRMALKSALPALEGAAFSRELHEDLPGAIQRIRMAVHDLATESIDNGTLVSGTRAAIVLVLDQMEELFTIEGVAHGEITRFLRGILMLVQSGAIHVIATLRSDFYARCSEFPELIELKGVDGQYDLIPPTPAEILQIIRYPALAAGLLFEVDESGQRLDDLLRDVTVESVDALPLLEFTLDELYKQRNGRHLTFAAYRKLGGLMAAVGARAEDVFEGLEENVQSQFAPVFRRLVASSGDDNRFTRRTTQWNELGNQAQRRFVEAFVAARLFTADRDANGEPTVRIAHEALLAHWLRARELLARERDSLRVRGRVEAAAQRWSIGSEKDDFLLPSGVPLQEALRLQSEHGSELTPVERRFITASARRAGRAKVLRRAAVALLMVLAVTAVIAGISARRQTAAAKVATRQASSALATSYLSEAERLEQSDPDASLHYYAAAYAADPSQNWIPSAVMNRVAYSTPPIHSAILADATTGARFSADGRFLVLHRASSIEIRTGNEFESVIARIPGEFEDIQLGPDRVVTLRNGIAETWALDATRRGAVSFALREKDGASITKDGRHLVIIHDGEPSDIRVVDLATGNQTAAFLAPIYQPTLVHSDTAGRLYFSGDTELAVTDLSGRVQAIRQGFPHLVCAAGGTRAACLGNTFTNGSGASPTSLIAIDGSGASLLGNTSADVEWDESTYDTIESAALDSMAAWIVARSSNNKICRWSIVDGKAMNEFNAAELLGNRVVAFSAISDDGLRVALLTADGTAFVFATATGQLLSRFTIGRHVTFATWQPGKTALVILRNGRSEFWQTERSNTAKALLFGEGAEDELVLSKDASVAVARSGHLDTTRAVAYSVQSLEDLEWAGYLSDEDAKTYKDDIAALERRFGVPSSNLVWEDARRKFPRLPPEDEDTTRTCSAARGLTMSNDAAGNSHNATLWNLTSGNVVINEPDADGAELSSANCHSLYYAGSSYWLRDQRGNMIGTKRNMPAVIAGAGVTEDGRYFDIHCDKEYRVIDASTGKTLVNDRSREDDFHWGVVMAPYGSQRLAVTTRDSLPPRFWDLQSGRQLFIDLDADGAVVSVSTNRILFHARDGYWIRGGDGRAVMPLVKLPSELRSVSVSADGRFFEAHTAWQLRLIDAQTGRTIANIDAEVIQPDTNLGYERGFHVSFHWARHFLIVSTRCWYAAGGIPCASHRVIEVYDDRQVTPAQLQVFVEAITGTTWSAEHTIVAQDRSVPLKRLQQMSLPTQFARFVAWSVRPPRNRTITPTSVVDARKFEKIADDALKAAERTPF
jgi:WD40 repeat protein